MNKLKFPEMIRQDALYALRTMRLRPGFAVTAILTLALAIGGNTAMFTIVRAVLLKPLPYPESDRLVQISGGATPLRFAEMKAGAHSVTELRKCEVAVPTCGSYRQLRSGTSRDADRSRSSPCGLAERAVNSKTM